MRELDSATAKLRNAYIFAAIATAVSVVSLSLAGFALAQLNGLRQDVAGLRQDILAQRVLAQKQDSAAETENVPTPLPSASPNSASPNSASPNSASSDSTSSDSTSSDSASSTEPTTSASSSGAAIQPKQFVQPAFGSSAEVELLSVKRIANPQSGNRDVVNVQFRLRRLSERIPSVSVLNPAQTTARNPDTSETYKPFAASGHSTDPMLLITLRTDASADGYVWMRVPESVSTIDLLLNDTQAFKNVPIAN